MKCYLIKSKGDNIVGITGGLYFVPHTLYVYLRKSCSPYIMINICTPGYYLLGFGEQIARKFCYIKKENNIIKISIYWNWLYKKLMGGIKT